MGNDGGSIPDRRDLVRTKPKAEQADKNNQIRAVWFFCALSKRPLQEPVVSCALGKLYNKDAIIEFLLDPASYGDGKDICGHVKSLKDVVTLKLTPNHAAATEGDEIKRAPFVCPLTLKEMSGLVPFVYIVPCGEVFSSGGLRAVIATSKSPSPPDDKDAADGATDHIKLPASLALCPQCGAKYDPESDVRTLNPPPAEAARMRLRMEAAALLNAESKKGKSKKRKAAAAALDGVAASEGREVLTDGKRARTTTSASAAALSAPSTNMSPAIAAVNRKVGAALAEEEARRKSTMSAAVASLYQDKNAKQRKETFLTMNTFTRYA